MTFAQSLWEEIFIAALSGSSVKPPDGKAEEHQRYALNRAQAIADDAVSVIGRRRAAAMRAAQDRPKPAIDVGPGKPQ